MFPLTYNHWRCMYHFPSSVVSHHWCRQHCI